MKDRRILEMQLLVSKVVIEKLGEIYRAIEMSNQSLSKKDAKAANRALLEVMRRACDKFCKGRQKGAVK